MTTTTKNTESLLLEIFGGNPYHARSNEKNGDIYYAPVEIPLSGELITEHLEGRLCLGSYQLIHGAEVVRWLGWDVDDKDVKSARQIVLKIIKHLSSVPYCVEYSGGKGYHILIFLEQPMQAAKAKKVVDWVREKEGFASTGSSHVECFPKQAQLTSNRPKGNLLKLPLGLHPRTHNKSVFVDPANGWEHGLLEDPDVVLRRRAKAEDVLDIVSENPDTEVQLTNLMIKYWEDGRRHDVSLFLSGLLTQEGWGIDQTKSLIENICKATGDTEIYNRMQTVESTYQKYKEGKRIRGRQGLGEMMSISDMQKLTELVAAIRSPDTVAQIDDIRYSKARSKLDNVRLASSTIWSIMNDEGNKLFQTDQTIAYWYNVEDHSVTQEGSESWEALLNKLFGLNLKDSFSQMLFKELRLRIIRDSPIVAIQNRTYWSESEKKLYVNLGGPEVYILDGITIETAYNGECGHMFVTNERIPYAVPDFNAKPVDAWDYLVNDLSFTTSPDAPAKPEEQRELLKAWLLSFFFQELMPTKPILAMLGQPGSGKTTAIRRILRILENPDSDVLGVPTDKQDSFRASIEAHRLLVIDNLEKSGAWWMVDILNKLATGNHIELRELYKTNVRHVIIPRCFVACTAVNMPFSDETLFSRLLVLEMQKLDEQIAENVLQRKIREYGPAIWADLLRKLNVVISALNANPNVKPPTQSRLVDFNVFCARIRNCGIVDGEKLNLGLLSMIDAQLRQLKESSQAVVLIEEWISMRPDEASEWKSFAELFSILQIMAQSRRMDFRWKNSVGLERHLSTLDDRLKKDYSAEIRSVYSPQHGKDIMQIRFRTRM